MTEKDLDAFEFDSWEFFRSATVEDVRDRLRAGSNSNERDEDGFTPLHTAVGVTKDPEVIVAMLQAGGKARSRTDADVTPLHSAAMASDEPRVLEILLEAGAKPNARNGFGRTPLHMAAERRPGNPKVIEVLLRAGAKPNVRDGNNYTPLLWAASNCQDPAVIEVLIGGGAEPNMKGVCGSTALQMAVSANSWAWGEDGKTDIAEALIRAGADPNLADDYGQTAMHFASSRLRIRRVFELLIEAGGNLTTRNCDGKTPVQVFGWKKENPEIYEYLKLVQVQQKAEPRPLLGNRQAAVPAGRGDTGSSMSRLRAMLAGYRRGKRL